MTDRPILFSGPMVNAILDGRKTQTRRVLKVPKWTNRSPEEFVRDETSGFWKTISAKSGTFKDLPTYKVGDRLYVREAHYLTDDGDNEYAVFATDEDAVLDHKGSIVAGKHQFGLSDEWAKRHLKLRPSIHMPRWASRLTLVVTNVRVQRLQEISKDDALAEGVHPDEQNWAPGRVYAENMPTHLFGMLWDSINDARGHGWDANDWVVAVTFETHHCNIDQMEAVKCPAKPNPFSRT